jgi:uncharacterized protein (DUF305 family)
MQPMMNLSGNAIMEGRSGAHSMMSGNTTGDPFAEANARMMQDMHDTRPTGDVDYDFVVGMIPHHQGAVDMSEVLLASEQADPELRILATEIVQAQTREMQIMKTWLSRYGDPRPRANADAVIQGYQRSMMTMMSGMQRRSANDINQQFVTGMIPHHQGAVAMSKILLESGQAESELALLAKEIIEAQSDEKIFLESWLSKNPEPKPNEEAVEIIQAYQASMMGMMGGMGMHDIRDVDINNRFIEGMIPHHQAAIKMAEVLLKYSNDAELRSMSQAVVREQTREITQMQNWLDQQ